MPVVQYEKYFNVFHSCTFGFLLIFSGCASRKLGKLILHIIKNNFGLSEHPEIIFPSASTAYPTKIRKLRYDDDIEEFASQFEWIEPETLLDQHMPVLDELNQSGLSITRIFAMRLYIEKIPSP